MNHGQRPEAGAGDFVIAIDGPSGTGKSSVSRRVAEILGAGYLDTGAMYRVVTLAVLRAEVDPADGAAIEKVLSTLDFVTPRNAGRQQHVLHDADVTTEIRGHAVTLAVTPVSANPAVRSWLFDRQQLLAHSGRMVVEGRDIGTVIAPDAQLKIYLTADPDERARRRYGQHRAATVGASTSGTAGSHDLASVALDLARRDTHDSTRAHAPLQAADDALFVDSSGMALEETVETVLQLAAKRGIS